MNAKGTETANTVNRNRCFYCGEILAPANYHTRDLDYLVRIHVEDGECPKAP